MRRLASVFAASSRRTDKPDPPPSTSHPPAADDIPRIRLVQKKSAVFSSLSRKLPSSADPPSLPPLVASDLANSSSSSSSGSTTLRTPDDDGLPRTPSKKGSWRSWLGGKNAVTSDHPEEHHPPPWQSSHILLRPPMLGSSGADDASLHSDVPCTNLDDDTYTPSYSPQQMATARANARTMILNSLAHEPTSPPLFQLSNALSFPRSCHSSRRLCRRETLESELHKKSLLARLDRPSPSAELAVAPLASKPISPRSDVRPNLHVDDIFPSVNSLSLHSDGLRSWISRPCFEDRFQLWTRLDSGDIICTRIPGSHFGVAALEFSGPLELLASTLLGGDEDVEEDIAFNPALEFTPPPLALNTPATQRNELELEPLSLLTGSPHSKDPHTQPSPSLQSGVGPLIMSTPPSPPTRQPDDSTASGSAATNSAIPKRGVRFADDDGKDDQIPLGYVLRIRKNKEQKAQFLREERERRERAAQLSVEDRRATAPPQEDRASRVARHAPPRPLISLSEPSKPQQPAPISHVIREEERLRREAEKVEMDKLRRSRELAKKQAEERERAYIEELQATRARREASRAGRPLESASLSLRVPDRDRPVSRDSMHASVRGLGTSHKHTPELVFSPISPYEGSPSSSAPATPGSQYNFSRPSSLYSAHTASSEDVRGRDGRRASRRASLVSDPAKGMSFHPPYDPRASFNPYAWAGVSPVPAIPPVPPMPAIPTVNGIPFYGVDMPLLPPTPPFMMNQLGTRPRSYTGLAGQHSPLQSLTSLPRNYSSEGATFSSRKSSPHSSGSHQRHSSDDTARMAKTPADSRSGNYNDARSSKTSVPMISTRVTPSQSSPQRSSWLPAEQSVTKELSWGPVPGSYSSGAPVHVRRQTAAS